MCFVGSVGHTLSQALYYFEESMLRKLVVAICTIVPI